MKFFIDGRFDIRPLGPQDKPHASLPYDYFSLYFYNEEAIAQGGAEVIEFTQADWGTGKNFYVSDIFTLFTLPVGSYAELWEGIGIVIYEDDGVSYPGIFDRILTPRNYPAMKTSEAGGGSVFYNFIVNKNKVNAANKLAIEVQNMCGEDLSAGALTFTISGIAIDF